MIIIFTTLIFFSTLFFSYSFLGDMSKSRRDINARLEELKVKRDIDDYDELSLPFYQRILRPLGNNLSQIVTSITPSGIKIKIDNKLIMAGNPFNMDSSKWVLVKGGCLFSIPTLTLISISIFGKLTVKSSLMLILSIIIAFLLPNLVLISATGKRQREIINTLPDVLDLMTVSVEAGLSFDGALSRLIEKFNGPLAAEFGRVLNEIRMGRVRKDALKEMGIRCGVVDLSNFISAIVQADELGVGISNVLRIQSNQMREKRRQRAQEKAMKAPVKMLLPLVFFIFPTIFSVLLGPALIQIMNEFIK